MPRVISQSPPREPLTVARLLSEIQDAIKFDGLSPEEPIYLVLSDGKHTDRVTLCFKGADLVFKAE